VQKGKSGKEIQKVAADRISTIEARFLDVLPDKRNIHFGD